MSVSRNEAATEQIVMNGDGFVTCDHVVGNGTWIHSQLGGPAPIPLLGTGTWKARRLVSMETIGSYGLSTAGTLTMDISMFSESGDGLPASIVVNCNVPRGLSSRPR